MLARARLDRQIERASDRLRLAQAAETRRRAILPAAERCLVELRKARMLATHIDATREMIATVASIDAQLSSLAVAA